MRTSAPLNKHGYPNTKICNVPAESRSHSHLCLIRAFPTEPHRNTQVLHLCSFFCSHSNSCTLALAWAYRRCLYIAVRCMGKLAQSAAWPETLIAPGMAANARDTFLPPRGRSMNASNKSLTFLFILRGPLEPACFFSPTSSVRVNAFPHLGVISAPAV